MCTQEHKPNNYNTGQEGVITEGLPDEKKKSSSTFGCLDWQDCIPDCYSPNFIRQEQKMSDSLQMTNGPSWLKGKTASELFWFL